MYIPHPRNILPMINSICNEMKIDKYDKFTWNTLHNFNTEFVKKCREDKIKMMNPDKKLKKLFLHLLVILGR